MVSDGVLDITGGTNTFGDGETTDIVSAKDLKISNGINKFDASVNIGSDTTSTFVTTGGENTFNGLMTYTGNAPVELKGNTSAYDFSGGLEALNTSALSLENPNGAGFKIRLNAPNAIVTVNNLSTLIIDATPGVFTGNAKRVDVKNGGTLKVTSDGTNAVNLTLSENTGLTVEAGGTLDLTTAKLDLGATGVLNLSNASKVQISASNGIHGQISGDQLNAQGVVHLELTGEEADFITDGGIIFNFNDLTIPTGSRFDSPWYGIEIDAVNGDVKVTSKKNYENVIEDLAAAGNNTVTENQRRSATLIQKIIDDGNSPDLANKLNNLVEEVNNRLSEGTITPDQVETILNHLIGDPLLNAPKASYETALKVQGAVFGRLDHIRSVNSITPPSAGGPNGELTHVWAGGFGTWSRQNTANGVTGYKYSNGGFAIGADHEFYNVPGLVVGVSLAFSFGTIDVNDGLSEIDVKTSGFGFYGSYTNETGLFVDGSLNFGFGKNSASITHLLDNTVEKGDFRVNTVQFAGRVGKTIVTESAFTVTPLGGIRITSYRQGGFTGRVEGESIYPNNIYGSVKGTIVELPLEVRVQTEFPIGTSIATPELRLGYTFLPKTPKGSLSTGFEGSDERTELLTSSPNNSYFNAGLGVKVDTQGALDIFANYDFNLAKNYRAHQLSAGLGYNF
jgi:outer membrane autotransporter protein